MTNFLNRTLIRRKREQKRGRCGGGGREGAGGQVITFGVSIEDFTFNSILMQYATDVCLSSNEIETLTFDI